MQLYAQSGKELECPLMLKKLSLTFIFLFYAVILLAVLLVVRFPKDAVLTRVEQKIENRFPGYSCEISDIRYIYPRSIMIEGVAITKPDQQSQLPVTNILVTPDLKNILTRFDMSLELFEGTLNTRVILHRENNRVELPTLEISGVNLKEVSFLEQSLGRGVDGIVELSGRYSGDRGQIINGAFSGTIGIKDFQMELKRPILQSKQVVFTELRTFIQLKNGLVEVVDGTAAGPFYDANFNGSIKLRRLWRASILSVGGTISPKQEYLEKNRQVARAAALLYKKYKSSTIPYKLTGTLEDPVFIFGDK